MHANLNHIYSYLKILHRKIKNNIYSFLFFPTLRWWQVFPMRMAKMTFKTQMAKHQKSKIISIHCTLLGKGQRRDIWKLRYSHIQLTRENTAETLYGLSVFLFCCCFFGVVGFFCLGGWLDLFGLKKINHNLLASRWPNHFRFFLIEFFFFLLI